MEVYDSANKMFDRLATLYNKPGVAALLGPLESPGGHEVGQDLTVAAQSIVPRDEVVRVSRRSVDGGTDSLEQLVGEACRGCVTVMCALTCGCVKGMRAAMSE